MSKLLFTVREAAECLSLSRSKVYELIASGALPSVRVGGARRITAKQLHNYVASLTGEQEQEVA